MQVSDFHFELPDELIARYPKADRTASRLLQLNGNTGALTDSTFKNVLDLVEPGDLLVFNNTRVIPARMFGRKASGANSKYWLSVCLMSTRFLLTFDLLSRQNRIQNCIWVKMMNIMQ